VNGNLIYGLYSWSAIDVIPSVHEIMVMINLKNHRAYNQRYTNKSGGLLRLDKMDSING
jgi:hypothetical protein